LGALTFINAKWDEHIAFLNKVDPQNQFEIIVKKWKKISAMVMNVDLSLQMRNDLGCKDKWGSIYGQFNKLFNHLQERVKMETIVL
jgi:hypothetical protein